MGRVKFNSLLANGRLESDLWMYKSAQQADDTQFENDFSGMAMQFLQDRAPALMSYILGFEVVDRSDDQTRAVGIFGFKIDDDYYYVPAFFLNSQVKGVESILSKKTNSFIPLTEEWVNFIINRRATIIGKAKEEKAPEEFENPNFEFLRRPLAGPLGTMGGGLPQKMGADRSSPDWNGGLKYFPPRRDADGDEVPWTLKQAWEVMRYRVAEGLSKDAGFREAAAGLHGALVGKHSILKSAAAYPASSSPLHSYLLNVGGPRAAHTFLKEATSSVKLANAVLEFYGGLSGLVPRKYPRTCHAVKAAQEAALLNNPQVTFTDRSDGTEESARNIVEDGFTVLDRRDPDHSSSVVAKDYEKTFQNPDAPGVYDVLCVGGVSHEAYVLDMDRINRGGTEATTVVYFPDNDQVVMTRNCHVVVHGDRKKSSRSVYDEADKLSSIRPGSSKEYLFIGPDGSCIGKWRCDSVTKEDGGRTVMHGRMESYCSTYYLDRDSGLQYSGSSSWSVPFNTVELADFSGRPVSHGSTLVMPSNWRVLDTNSHDEDSDDIRESSGIESLDTRPARSERKTHELGSLASLKLELRKQGAAELDAVSDDGSEFYFRFDGNGYTRPAGYKQAAVMLVTRLGMRYPDAKSLLKSAAVNGSEKILLKMGQMVGVNPQMPPEQSASADPYTGIPVYETPYAQETRNPFDGVEPPPVDNVQGENIDGEMTRDQEAQFDQEAEQLAVDAAQAGQKNVFDQAAIGGLAKVYDTGAVVDSYLPEFMQAIDRLGRVLFLYHWKQDDFVERYGVDTVVQMEEVLKSTFKQLGKLTLDLRRKAVGQGDVAGN